MRDFLEYVQRSKEDFIIPLDYYVEGFSTDLLKMEGMDHVKAFILGFLAGKGVNILKNKDELIEMLKKEKEESTAQAISNIKTNDESLDLKDLRASLAKALIAFRTIFKNKKEEK